MVTDDAAKLRTDIADQRTLLTFLTFVVVLIPAIVAFGLLYRERICVPFQDDYAVILSFASDYQRLPTVSAKLIEAATAQNNDYKLAFVHFIVAAQMEVTGHLNFRILVTLGNLLLFPIAYLAWLTYRRDGSSLRCQLMEFLPISMLLFSLSYWETLNWAAPALQNLSVILFSLLAIRILSSGEEPPSPTRLLVGCASGVLSALSSANGFFLAPIVFFMLLRRRAIAASLIWCGSFLLPAGAYLYHYVPYHESFQRLHSTSLISKVGYVFAFMGCAIPYRWPAAFLGIAAFAVIGLAAYTKLEQTKPASFYFSLWILATAVLVGWLRGTIESRYSIYSILLLIFCYSFLNDYLAGALSLARYRSFYLACVVLTVGFLISTNLNAYTHLSARRTMIMSGLDHYRRNPELNSPTIDPKVAEYKPHELEFERVVLNRVIEEHIYALPQRP